jgi:phosphatidylserine/phosphatidylglycerophosphate/cardiolipin synthase-like enzyme
MELLTPLEWLLVATGCTGALTAVHWLLWLRRRLVLQRPQPQVEVHFSPKGGATEAIVREITAARQEILVLAYSFTHDPIVDALIAAHQKGLIVEVILDKSMEVADFSDLPRGLEWGLPILIDDHHAIAHNKVMVIDRRTIITGSFNFTKQAELQNAENLVILKGYPDITAAYLKDFQHHKEHARAPKLAAKAGTTDKGAHAHEGPHKNAA